MSYLTSTRTLLGSAVTIVFFGLLFWHTDFAQLGEAIKEVQPVWLALAAAVYFPGVWCRAARWQALLAPLKQMPVARLYPIVVIGYMINDLVPLRAGELARAALLRRNEGVPPVATLSTIGVERVSDGLTLLLFAAVGGLAAPLDAQTAGLVQGAAWLFLAAIVGALILTLNERLALRLAGQLTDTLPKRAGALLAVALALVEHGFAGLRALRSPRTLALAGWWAVAAWLGELLVFSFVAQAFGLDVPIAVLALAMAAANLATSIPASQAGIGPFEYFCAQVLLVFGVAPGVAVAYALVIHAVLILPVVLAGFFHLWRQGLDVAAVLRPLPQAGQ